MEQAPPPFLNVEYWFRLIYDCFHGACTFSTGAFFSNLWVWITIIGFFVAIAALLVLIYSMYQLFELRKREHEALGVIHIAPEAKQENARWVHIDALISSENPSDWRQAIIEADILLDNLLIARGYQGENLGEKLKQVKISDLASLNDAWEAHKVRNQIAHDGSAFKISDTLARRTIARYEGVFREFDLI